MDNKPKFMRVNADINRIKPHNKHLLRPLVGGELVKIDTDQEPDLADVTAESWRRRFVRVIRRDDNGVWGLKYVTTHDALEPLKK